MARRQGYAPNVAVIRTVVRGPHPISVANVGGIDSAYGRAMAGDNGAIRIGEKSSPSRKFSGELGPLQRFAGGLGATHNQLHSLRGQTALPGTNTPAGVPNRVQALLAATQGVTQ